jgi:hypothetical protein
VRLDAELCLFMSAQMPVWAWTALVFGGTLIAALVCWLIYLKLFFPWPYEPASRAAPSAAPAAAPAAPTSSANPQAPEGTQAHGTFVDTAARGAIAAAARARAAAHNFLNSFYPKRTGSPPAAASTSPAPPIAAPSPAMPEAAPAGDASAQAPVAAAS